MSGLKSDLPPEDLDSAPSLPAVAVREASPEMASILATIDAAMARSAADEQAEAAARLAPMMNDGDRAEIPVMEKGQTAAPRSPSASEPAELKIPGGAEARSRLHWFIGVADTTSLDPGSLTYEPFLGLREKPFSLSSDPRFFFTHSSHGAAFDTLAAAIRRREGLLVLTGEVGTGKTTLCRAVLQSLDQKTFAAFVQDPFLSREDLLKTLLVDFGVVSVDEIRSGRLRGASRTDLSYPLYDFLASLQPLKAFAVVIIDEAQNLTAELLDEIRILSDLDKGQKLLEVVLVGQPELQARLATSALRQVNQRVTVRCELAPLVRDDVTRYISHRLAVAGNDGRVRFTTAAVEMVWAASNGIPRVINLVCDRALLCAARARETSVAPEHVRWAVDDLKLPVAQAVQASWDALESFPVEAGQARTEPQAQPEPASVAPIGLTLGKRRPLIEWPDLSDVPDSSEASESPDVSSAAIGNKVDDIPRSNFWETTAARQPAFVVDTGAARQRRRTLLVALAACLALTAGFAGYWYSKAPARPQAAVEQPTQSRPPIQAAPAAVLTPIAAPETLPAPAPAPAPFQGPKFAIRMATFQSQARTEQALQELRDAGFKAYSVEGLLGNGTRVFAVFLGPYADRAEADLDRERAQQVRGYGGGFIAQVE
jgi:type II secretory pathway predicted ATPase ExeA/cell division septation protein DedD